MQIQFFLLMHAPLPLPPQLNPAAPSIKSQPVDDDAATPLDGARSALKSLPWSLVSWPPRLLWLLTICILLLIWWFVLLLLFPTY